MHPRNSPVVQVADSQLGFRIWALAALILSALSIPVLLAAGFAGQKLAASPEHVEGAGPVTGGRSNVLLITVETFRRDHCSLYGYARDTTPFLRELAGEGTVYTRAYSASSWTRPSIASVMTGLRPTEHRTTARSDRLPEAHLTLAERLSAAGYATAGMMANHILQPRAYGYDQGHQCWPDATDDTAGPLLDRAAAWIAQQKEPWYVHVHPMDPHGPYEAPRPYAGKWAKDRSPAFADGPPQPGKHPDPAATLCDADWPYLRACYDEEIAYTDAAVGRLIGWLRRTRRLHNTLVIVTGDHGEALGEHDRWGHGYMLSEEQVAVPLIVKWPGGQDGGTTCEAPVYGPDIFATILSQADCPVPGDAQGLPLEAMPSDRSLTLEYVARTSEIARRTGRDSDAVALVTRDAYRQLQCPRKDGARPAAAPDLARALRAVRDTPSVNTPAEANEEPLSALRDLGYL